MLKFKFISQRNKINIKDPSHPAFKGISIPLPELNNNQAVASEILKEVENKPGMRSHYNIDKLPAAQIMKEIRREFEEYLLDSMKRQNHMSKFHVSLQYDKKKLIHPKLPKNYLSGSPDYHEPLLEIPYCLSSNFVSEIKYDPSSRQQLLFFEMYKMVSKIFCELIAYWSNVGPPVQIYIDFSLRAAPSARRAPRACLYSGTCNSTKTLPFFLSPFFPFFLSFSFFSPFFLLFLRISDNLS